MVSKVGGESSEVEDSIICLDSLSINVQRFSIACHLQTRHLEARAMPSEPFSMGCVQATTRMRSVDEDENSNMQGRSGKVLVDVRSDKNKSGL